MSSICYSVPEAHVSFPMKWMCLFHARSGDGMEDLRYKPANGMHTSSRQILQTMWAEEYQILGFCSTRAASQPRVPMCGIPLIDRSVKCQWQCRLLLQEINDNAPTSCKRGQEGMWSWAKGVNIKSVALDRSARQGQRTSWRDVEDLLHRCAFFVFCVLFFPIHWVKWLL